MKCNECEYFMKGYTHTFAWGDVDICMLYRMTGIEPDAECLHYEKIFVYTHGHNEKCTKGKPKIVIEVDHDDTNVPALRP